MNIRRKTWMMLVAVVISSCHTETFDIASPDGDLKVTVELAEENAYGEILFSVDYEGKRILSQSKLGLETDAQKLAGNLKLKSVSAVKHVTDDYRMITGKRSHCVNEATERTYSFENEVEQSLEVTFRVYNDGIAFKYGINTVADEENVVHEHTTYAVPKGTRRWVQEYDPGYEKFFPLSTDGKLTNRPEVDLWGYPALVEPQDSVFMLITEANIRRGHCGSLLYNGDQLDSYQVRLADKQPVGNGAWESPWRLLIVGNLSDVVESTLVTDVSDPSKVEDTEWIIPGMVSWIYWAYNHGSKDYQRVKEYIDLAVRMKWPYNLIDWEWDEMENGGNLQDAVKYKLILNFHGATIPRGWQRTYPHMMSVEGLYGAEWYNNNAILTNRAAEHNVTLPFTRNVIGQMDYTPRTFSDSQHPHITSHGHELALPVIFESAL